MIVDEAPLDLSWANIKHYAATRITSLWPRPVPGAEKPNLNPFPALRKMNAKQWNFFIVAFLGWTWDAVDFFTVSLTATQIAKTFDKKVSDVTWGITLVLMLRSVGAVIFGLAGDKWGRKWPFIANLFLFVIFEIAAGFAQSYQSFLACRALFGIAMGGLYGNAA